MSYYLCMRFAQANDISEALSIAHELQKTVCDDDIRRYIVDNVYFWKDGRMDSLGWLHKHLKLKFAYFKDAKVVGIYGTSLVSKENFEKMNFGKPIRFQNSSDQDEEWDHWLEMKSPVMRDIIKEYQEKPVELLAGYDPLDDFEEEYNRKSLLYKRVFEGFGIEDCLYTNSSNLYESFSFSLIGGMEKEFDVIKIMKYIDIIYSYYDKDIKLFIKYHDFSNFYAEVLKDDSLRESIFNSTV